MIIAAAVVALCFGIVKYNQHKDRESVRIQAEEQASVIAEQYDLELTDVVVRRGEGGQKNMFYVDYYISDFSKLTASRMYSFAEALEEAYSEMQQYSYRVNMGHIYCDSTKYFVNTHLHSVYRNGEVIPFDYYDYKYGDIIDDYKISDGAPVSTPAPSYHGGKIYDTSPDASDFSNPEDFYDYYYDDFFDYYDAESYYYDNGGE